MRVESRRQLATGGVRASKLPAIIARPTAASPVGFLGFSSHSDDRTKPLKSYDYPEAYALIYAVRCRDDRAAVTP